MGFKKRSKVSAEFSMSSLTDIIFLLLIFFMLTSTIVSPNAIVLKLPSSSRSKAQASRKPLTVKVSAQKQYSVNGQNIMPETLSSTLTDYIQNDGRSPDEITAIIDIHPEVDAQTLVDVVTQVNELKLKMVLATEGIKQ